MANSLPEHCRTLFLGDLSAFCQENDLYQLFRKFGNVEEIRVKRSKEGTGLGYGFVTFYEMNSAAAALELEGTVILGRPVK
jgi:RNA recognition motif-containing protein